MNTTIKSALQWTIFSFFMIFLFACTEDVVEADEVGPPDLPEAKVIEVLTKQPEVDLSVLFKGEIKSLSGVESIEYGFMWYEPDAEVIDVREISVGRTSEVLTFSHEIEGLPKKPKLIVCSYARVAGTEETIIGEEVSFSNDL